MRILYATRCYSGAGDVLLYASKYHDIPTVVEASACYDPKKGIEKLLGKDFMEKIKKDGFIDIGNMLFIVMCGRQRGLENNTTYSCPVICKSKFVA